MRCIFCFDEVLKQTHLLGRPISVSGQGIAHSLCAERDLVTRRVFGSLELSSLPTSQLYELREMVLTEVNAREGHNNDGEVELF